jgi:tetrahydromethanopterin S-methyltransferase subunit G
MMETPNAVTELWQEDHAADGRVAAESGPNLELAVILLAAGCTQHYIRRQCGFDSQRAVQQFCRDEDVLREVERVSGERAKRVGKRALVSLEKLVSQDHTDLRAQVLAIRTALEVAGDLKREHAAPVKSVRELTVPELNQLIDATKAELSARITRRVPVDHGDGD